MRPPDPRPGDFAVVIGTLSEAIRQRNFGAALIEIVTKGPAYHAVSYEGNGIGIEARPGGAGYVRMDHYPADHLLWSHRPLTDDQRRTIVQSARSFIGTPYGWGDDLAIGLDALGLHWPPIEDRLTDKGTVICSQLVAVGQVRADDPISTKDPARVTPNDLRAAILAGTQVPVANQ